MSKKIDVNFLYLSEFIPDKYIEKPKYFSKHFEIYDSEIQGFLGYKIEFKKEKSWKCFVNRLESNIEKTIEEFKIEPIVNRRFIYLLRVENSNTFKIGRTKYLNHRSRDFGFSLPFKTSLESWFIGEKYDENKFHEFFKTKRLNGEWFSLNEQDILFFKSFQNKTYEKL